MTVTADPGSTLRRKQPVWLITAAIGLAGILLLADAFELFALYKITAQLGISLLFSALALLVGKGRWPGFVATAIIWLAVITMLLY